MGTVRKMISAPMRATIDKLYKDLGWSAERQAGFNTRACGRATPLTTADASKVIQGLQAMLMQLVRPHYGAFTRLVSLLRDNAADLNPWERRFLADVIRKIGGKSITPAIIKKVRQTAHKYQVECGFPSFRELAAAADTARAQERV